MMKRILLSFGTGVILQWLTLFGSYRPLPHFYDNVVDFEPVAVGGFPFKVFEYPYPPMGDNWPPAEAWPAFFLNLLFWIIIGIIITWRFGDKLKNKKIVAGIVLMSIFLSIIGAVYLRLKFD
jgi:hypothetical protein